MNSTDKVPNVPVTDFKRTKIVATLGPATHSYPMVRDLIKGGANAIRLNFSHGTHEERDAQIPWIRKASEELGKPVAIIQDLHGPKMQLGDFDGFISVQKGQALSFKYKTDYERTGLIPTEYDLSKKVKRGERLKLSDGRIRTTITSVTDGVVHTRAENDGVLVKRKGINLPDTDFAGDILPTKDRQDIAYGSTHDMDYVAMSFVQTAADIRKLRALLKSLGSEAKIIAKIETKAAVEHINAIVEEADALMVARGDLAVETEPESVPIVQRKIIELGLKYAKPVIVATQVLASMVDMPEPTRAEASDAATAAILGADAVMLSEETAVGKYPLESVQILKRIINYTQKNQPLALISDVKPASRQNAISAAIIELAQRIDARAIVAETASGATALQIASHRPNRPLIAVTAHPRVAQQLALVYGIKSYVRPTEKFAATKLTNWLRQKKVLNKGDMVVTASGQYPGVVGTTDTIKVRLLE